MSKIKTAGRIRAALKMIHICVRLRTCLLKSLIAMIKEVTKLIYDKKANKVMLARVSTKKK